MKIVRKAKKKTAKTSQKDLLSLILILLLALALPLFIWVVINQRLEVREKAAGCTEQCPGSDGVLRNCTPPESDGSSADSLCNFAGRIEPCGGQNYCCPGAGGVWTTDMSACGQSNCKPGDVNCDTHVNIVDVGILIDAYGSSPPSDPRADLYKGDNLNIVNINDLNIIIEHYEL